MSKLPHRLLIETMKAFNVDKVLRSNQSPGLHARLGTLQFGNGSSTNASFDDDVDGGSDEGRGVCASYRTPMYLIHTQTGSIPHITPEVLNMIYPSGTGQADSSSPIPPLQISLNAMFKSCKSVMKFGKGLGKFVGMPDVPTFLVTHDPLYPLRAGYNDKFGIALWSRHGRACLTPQDFTGALKAFKVNFSQMMSDYDLHPETSGMKRLRKSLSRAEEYTSYVLKHRSAPREPDADDDEGNHRGSPTTGLFITLEAAWFKMDEGLAEKTVKALLESQHEIEGAVLSGLTDQFPKKKEPSKAPTGGGGEEEPADGRKHLDRERLGICEELDFQILSKMVESLPQNLPKYVPGPFKLPLMVDLISRGVDILDSSVASRMADESEAFLLDEVETGFSSIFKKLQPLTTNGFSNETLPERVDERGEDKVTDSSSGGSPVHKGLKKEPPIISLKDKRYFDDFRPLSRTCSCYTCRKHTRSYVHHLYATDELLGPVLLQIHNLTTLERFFKLVRLIIEDCESPEILQAQLSSLKNILTPDPSSPPQDVKEAEAETEETRMQKQAIN